MRFDPMLGSLVGGKYRVDHLLAEGGMGRVYAATQESLGRAVALKVVRHDTGHIDEAAEAEAQERFRFEASVLARLRHPNIVTLYDFGELDGPLEGRSFLAMELLQGATLAERLDNVARLPVLEVLAIAEQIVIGLRYAHGLGVIHRDMKPANVMLVRDEVDPDCARTVKILDFGTSKLTPAPESPRKNGLTQDGFVIGTPEYMAPEQLGGRPCPASDLFAVGVIMFEALTGVPPFGAQANGSSPPLRLREAAPGLVVPDSVETLVMRLLARKPSERPSANQLLESLEQCLVDAATDARALTVVTSTTTADANATSREAVVTSEAASTATAAAEPRATTLLASWRRVKWQVASACLGACALAIATVSLVTGGGDRGSAEAIHFEGGLRSGESMARSFDARLRAKASRPRMAGASSASAAAATAPPVPSALPPVPASAPTSTPAERAPAPRQNPSPTRTVFSVVDTER